MNENFETQNNNENMKLEDARNNFQLRCSILTLFWTWGEGIPPPNEFFDCSALKDSTKLGSWGM